ncbi:MAG TPA: hypothetical protein VKB41_01755 [Steroidobacteraceae bacterium]|nr:hypothetical protein [Steroidobacteraceae bacterium]
MKLRLLIASGLLALLTGCVSVGGTDVLITPLGVVALHSFKPPQSQPQPDKTVAANDVRQPVDSDR